MVSNIIVGKIIGSAIQAVTVLIFFKTIFYNKDKKLFFKVRDIVCMFILMFLILLIYSTEYITVNPILSFLSIVFVLVLIYKMSLSKAFLCAGLFMIFLFISDLIVSIILVSFLDIEAIRGVTLYVILSNLAVGIIAILLINVKKIKIKVIEIIEINEKKESIETMSFIALLIAALSITVYALSKNYTLNKFFILGAIGIIIFIILTIIFFKEKFDKEKVINRYDQLFEYVQTFEEWIDNENMNVHESKNQLATLRDMVKRNKKAVEYIDNIIKERINTESKNIQPLKYIPKGGLKGILYYKITIAENKNISLLVDVSKNSEKILKTLNMEENKMLCRLVGIFFDNAIEAVKDLEKKSICCEIYNTEDKLNIAISNTFSGKIELNKLSQNGYSTKGKNRGKGLYLAKKFSKKHNAFSLESRIINDYYVQKITIKKDTIGIK